MDLNQIEDAILGRIKQAFPGTLVQLPEGLVQGGVLLVGRHTIIVHAVATGGQRAGKHKISLRSMHTRTRVYYERMTGFALDLIVADIIGRVRCEQQCFDQQAKEQLQQTSAENFSRMLLRGWNSKILQVRASFSVPGNVDITLYGLHHTVAQKILDYARTATHKAPTADTRTIWDHLKDEA